MLPKIKRPRILIKAAKIGLKHYEREKGLEQLLRLNKGAKPESVVEKLVAAEATINEQRVNGGASYSLDRHINLLTALLNEMCLLERKKV